ncbi:Hypothetical protein CINCED_3A015970 [Cinara cedri]|uniref:Uncharacterized protein n=1 Tax=Cinara cedri TaxID=506608 RepID=A0A5E4MFN2_9HEMI|nr:Hypothetical protein CINCED_3A015970 [Cinara cedri]
MIMMEPSNAVIAFLITVACVSATVVPGKQYRVGRSPSSSRRRPDWQYDDDVDSYKLFVSNYDDWTLFDDQFQSNFHSSKSFDRGISGRVDSLRASTEKPASRFGLSPDVDDDEDRFPEAKAVPEKYTVNGPQGTRTSYRDVLVTDAPRTKYITKCYDHIPRRARSIGNRFLIQPPFQFTKLKPTKGEERPVKSLLEKMYPILSEIHVPEDFPAHLAVTTATINKVPIMSPSHVAKVTPGEFKEASVEFPTHFEVVTPAPVVDGFPVRFPAYLAKATPTEDAKGVKTVTPIDTNNISTVNVHTGVADSDDLPVVVHDNGPGQVFKMAFNKNDPIIALLKDPKVFKDYVRVSVDLANVLPEMIEQMDVLTKRCLHISWESENVLVLVKSKPMANGECMRYTAPMSMAEELNYTRQRWADRQLKH